MITFQNKLEYLKLIFQIKIKNRISYISNYQNKYELHKHKFNDSSDIKICLEMKKIAAIYTEASSYTYTVKPKLV